MSFTECPLKWFVFFPQKVTFSSQRGAISYSEFILLIEACSIWRKVQGINWWAWFHQTLSSTSLGPRGKWARGKFGNKMPRWHAQMHSQAQNTRTAKDKRQVTACTFFCFVLFFKKLLKESACHSIQCNKDRGLGFWAWVIHKCPVGMSKAASSAIRQILENLALFMGRQCHEASVLISLEGETSQAWDELDLSSFCWKLLYCISAHLVNAPSNTSFQKVVVINGEIRHTASGQLLGLAPPCGNKQLGDSSPRVKTFSLPLNTLWL